MKHLLALLAFIATSAQAAPFLYGNVEDGVTHCGMVLDGGTKITAPTVPGTTTVCKFDLASVANGQHSATLTAIIIDPVWGTQESAPSAPFTFVRPSKPSAPATLRLGQ